MVKGFVFGKFLPFHKGHEAMINFALSKCDFLTVLVCASDKETISGGLRKGWIEKTFPAHKKIEVRVLDYKEDELPNSSVSSTEVSRIWATVFKELFPDYSLVVTSEQYGYYLAEFMEIQHVPFDLPKKLVPVSATSVRNNLLANWPFVPDAVRRDLVSKVVILGTESTGKTTLTEMLAAFFNCNKVMEAGRDLIPDSNEFSIHDLHAVAQEHAKRIDAAADGSSPLVIIDTDIHITRSYCRFSFEKDLEVSAAIYHSNKAQLYFYLNNDVAYFQDGTRLSKQERDRLDGFHRQVLQEANINLVEITGNWDERFQLAVAQIKKLSTLQYIQHPTGK
ncbi:cytidyltransferase [Niastella yeongjuensis]|uniref:Cytidyltransferase n=1 Tax=Niastella yeongjuensis TaxID=354355 RepID=A0A1V9FC63_9BACT|nr:AAA family ATPase [Niastella yeongjuensis]OQP55837.1 cytidyltransferase [Niastella yeongjuensis]SEP47380.1 HTH-type transcriptional regulator, transcriptional repressor of NAD biosynthesis genes [Niastella yeongjuensis]